MNNIKNVTKEKNHHTNGPIKLSKNKLLLETIQKMIENMVEPLRQEFADLQEYRKGEKREPIA